MIGAIESCHELAYVTVGSNIFYLKAMHSTIMLHSTIFGQDQMVMCLLHADTFPSSGVTPQSSIFWYSYTPIGHLSVL